MSDTSRIYITRSGKRKLQERLDHLVNVERNSAIASLAKARKLGDLSENAEYHAAKDRQRVIENEINALQEKIDRVQIVSPSQQDKDAVSFGAVICVERTDKQGGESESFTYKLVSTDEVDFDSRNISTSSLIGRSLLGKPLNSVSAISTPRGEYVYKVLSIDYED